MLQHHRSHLYLVLLPEEVADLRVVQLLESMEYLHEAVAFLLGPILNLLQKVLQERSPETPRRLVPGIEVLLEMREDNFSDLIRPICYAIASRDLE